MAIIQVWSAPSCQSGAVCFGSLSPWLSAAGSEAQGTAPSFRMTVQRTVADDASLSEGRCLRVLSESRGEQWWFVTSVTHDDGDNGLVTVTAGSLRQLLAVRGLIRSGSTFAFTAGKRTVADLLTTYVLTNLADDSLSWLSLGTVEWLDVIEIAALDRATRGVVLDSIEQATGYTVKLRAVYTGTTLTGFAIDVLADPAAALEMVPLSVGAQVATLKRTQDALRAATVAVPFTSNGAAMSQTVWTVSSISGTAPAWLLLRDPVASNPYPIQQDDQFIGAYVMQRDGTATVIADARASDSAVQVASVGTIVAGDELTITRDTDGAPVFEITSPAGIATARGRLVAQVATESATGRRNLVQNPIMATWSSNTAPGSYTVTGGTAGRYARTSVTGSVTLQFNGAHVLGATTISLKGGTPGHRFYFREVFKCLSTAPVTFSNLSNAVVEVDAGGLVTVTLSNGIQEAVTDGTSVTIEFTGVSGQGPRRPASFPTEAGSPSVLRLLSAATQVEGVTARVLVPASSSVQVNIAAGLTITRVNVTTTVGSYPTLALRNTVGGTTLASASVASVPAVDSTVHTTLTASATITTSTTVAPRITAGTNVTYTSGPGITAPQWQGVRWLSIWTGTEADSGPVDGSGSNLLWHRAQQVLSGVGLGTRYTVTGVDLAHLLDGAAPLALGQSVRLRSDRLGINDTVKIVRLDYRFDQTESLNLELGTITPRLTGVTFDL